MLKINRALLSFYFSCFLFVPWQEVKVAARISESLDKGQLHQISQQPGPLIFFVA
jgi:hypothetical protein